MTKGEFIRKFAEDNDTTYALADVWVNAVLNQIAEEIVDNDRLEIRGLGIWEHQRYAGRTARNFTTNEPMTLPDTMGIKFRLSKTLTEKMRENYPMN